MIKSSYLAYLDLGRLWGLDTLRNFQVTWGARVFQSVLEQLHYIYTIDPKVKQKHSLASRFTERRGSKFLICIIMYTVELILQLRS